MISRLLFLTVIASTLVSCGKSEEKQQELKNNKVTMSIDYFFPAKSSENISKAMTEIFGKDASLLTGMLSGIESVRVRSWDPIKSATTGVIVNRIAGCMKGTMSFMVFPALESSSGATLSDGKIHKVYVKRARTENPLYLKATNDIVCIGTSKETLGEILKLRMEAPVAENVSINISLNGDYLFSQIETGKIVEELKRKQKLTEENEKITRKILAQAKHIISLKFSSILDKNLDLKTSIIADWDKVQAIMEPLAESSYPVHDTQSAIAVSIKGKLLALFFDTFLPAEATLTPEKKKELETFKKIVGNLAGATYYLNGKETEKQSSVFLSFSNSVPEMDKLVGILKQDSGDDRTAISELKNMFKNLKTSEKSSDNKTWYFADYELKQKPDKARSTKHLIDIRGDIYHMARFATGMNITGTGNSTFIAGISHRGKKTGIEINFNIKPLLEIGQKSFEQNRKKAKIPSDI